LLAKDIGFNFIMGGKDSGVLGEGEKGIHALPGQAGECLQSIIEEEKDGMV